MRRTRKARNMTFSPPSTKREFEVAVAIWMEIIEHSMNSGKYMDKDLLTLAVKHLIDLDRAWFHKHGHGSTLFSNWSLANLWAYLNEVKHPRRRKIEEHLVKMRASQAVMRFDP